jgi:hypothetical protein
VIWAPIFANAVEGLRPCLLLGYLRGWEDINSYPGISR